MTTNSWGERLREELDGLACHRPHPPRGIVGRPGNPVNESEIGRSGSFPEAVWLPLVGPDGSPYDREKSSDPAVGESAPPGAEPAVSQRPPPPGQGPLDPEDRRLVEACLAREPAAWGALLDRFGSLLAHVAGRTASRRGTPLAAADRDDAVAEIVLECLRDDALALRRFAGRSSLATYLAVIARRVTVRRLVRGRQAVRSPAAETPLEPAAPVSDLPERIDDREQVETLLGRLDDEDARLVRLHHLEGRSYGEISRHTGLPLGSIGPALSRARAKLRSLMEASSPPG
jgi:RNA polymerase sigma-70 factor, ECF subfamily